MSTEISAEERAAKTTTDMVVEMTVALFEKSSAYASLITVGGYAGAFSIWAFTSEHLTRLATAWIALLLGVSLTSFVLYEIFKMVVSARLMFGMATLLTPPRPPTEFLRLFQEFDQQRKRRSSTPTQIAVWLVALSVSVVSGLAAMSLLFYNMLAIILDWKVWPA